MFVHLNDNDGQHFLAMAAGVAEGGSFCAQNLRASRLWKARPLHVIPANESKLRENSDRSAGR